MYTPLFFRAEKRSWRFQAESHKEERNALSWLQILRDCQNNQREDIWSAAEVQQSEVKVLFSGDAG